MATEISYNGQKYVHSNKDTVEELRLEKLTTVW